MRTTHKPNRHTRGGASKYATIQQELWPESTHLHASSPTAAGLAAPGPTPAGITLVAVFRGANTWVLGGGVHRYHPTHHDRWSVPLLLVLAVSFRDRRQKGFQRKNSSMSLYPLSFRVEYETCTPQENKQTPTSLSFFFISFFLLFAPNLKELRVSAD